MQFRLNLLVLYVLVGFGFAIAGQWLPVVACILAAAALIPRVVDDFEVWTTWERAEANLDDAARQRALYLRMIDKKHGLAR